MTNHLFEKIEDVEDSIKQWAPKIIYKYRSDWKNDNNRKFITEQAAWFACPEELNDPYDIRIPVRFDTEEIENPIFLSKAFSLKDGQISNVFKTRFGYHIIQMVSRRGDDATIRHILKVPQVSSIEINQAIEKLDSIRTQLVSGKVQFGEAVSRFSEDDNSKFTGGRISGPDGSTFVAIDQLDKDLVLMLKDLKVGDYSKPTEFNDPSNQKKAVRIVEVITKTEPHRENLKDDYDKVAQRALEEKKNDVLESWFNKKIPTFYVNISKEYQTCPEVSEWVEKSTAQQ